MDPTLEGQYSTKEVVQVAAIAAMCVQAEADYRPLMADVVQSLVPLVRNRRSASKLSGCSSSFSLARSPNSPGKASIGSQWINQSEKTKCEAFYYVTVFTKTDNDVNTWVIKHGVIEIIIK